MYFLVILKKIRFYNNFYLPKRMENFEKGLSGEENFFFNPSESIKIKLGIGDIKLKIAP